MPASTTHRHPSGLTIAFSEAVHTYADDTGATYRSVSSVIKQFAPPFDAVGISQRVAKRRGMTPEAIQAEWRAAGDAACKYGTRVHEVAEWALESPERAIQGKQTAHAPTDMAEAVVFASAAKEAARIATDAKREGRRVYVEQLLAAPTLKIAGTCDLMIATDTEIHLIDWKTNKDLHKTFGQMLGPLAHLNDSPLTKYHIQINLYWRLIQEAYCTGNELPTMRGSIVHLQRTGKVETHTVPDMTKEIDAIIEALK